ncbi:hypothetical protein ABIA33_002930 [Streptacidiphilus sp. MAP12-16]|uniref:hypothetical protein n=1 Tax=Streptacidiphilus sp. MAP12-16 TaxID=3156300 RepID=UPI0035184631
MAMRRLTGYLVTATLVVAALAGCDSSASSPRAGGTTQISPAQVAAARNATLMVVDDYERAGSAAELGTAKKADPGGVAQYFADQNAARRFQGSGGIGAPLGCGVAAGKHVVDGAVIGTPVASQNAISIPVSLYIGTKQAAQVSVTADAASGRLKDFSCGPVAAPDLPGVQALVGYYGGSVAAGTDTSATAAINQLKQQFLTPAFAKWDWPGLRTDAATCAEDTMPYWHAVYAPTAAPTGGAQWYFWPAGQQVIMSVAVNPTANRVAWVFCLGELIPKWAPAAYSDDQIQSYVGDLFNTYAYLRALQPVGADASVIRTYFVSPDAYKAAADSTGPQPLECSQTAAGSIGADSVKVTGTTATVALTSAPSPHPVTAGQSALGHPKVILDLATMKIASVSCS